MRGGVISIYCSFGDTLRVRTQLLPSQVKAAFSKLDAILFGQRVAGGSRMVFNLNRLLVYRSDISSGVLSFYYQSD